MRVEHRGVVAAIKALGCRELLAKPVPIERDPNVIAQTSGGLHLPEGDIEQNHRKRRDRGVVFRRENNRHTIAEINRRNIGLKPY
ncbi:MAG: hypothetical protein ABI231_04940 [Candidatus Tumulicola sp.]